MRDLGFCETHLPYISTIPPQTCGRGKFPSGTSSIMQGDMNAPARREIRDARGGESSILQGDMDAPVLREIRDARASPARSSNSFFSNAGSSASSAWVLGRHGATRHNGRYGSRVFKPLDVSLGVRTPAENGKAERDAFSSAGGPSPGYGSSLSMENPGKYSDGMCLRGSYVCPSETRLVSSPCFHTATGYDPPTRLYAHEGPALSERDSSKFSESSTVRDTFVRDKGKYLGRPAYHRRTYSLPKLEFLKDLSGGDRGLLEGRIDRYGSASSRELASSTVLGNSNKEHHKYDRRSRAHIPFSGFSSRSACAPSSSLLKDIGAASVCLERPRPSSPPYLVAGEDSLSEEVNDEFDGGPKSVKKRPRLTWGQGLAKYEKEKIVEDYCTGKTSEVRHHGIVECYEDVHAASDCQSHITENGSFSPLHNQHHHEQDSCDSGVPSVKFERSSTDKDLAISHSLGSHKPLVLEHMEDPKLSPNEDPPFSTAVPHSSILHEAQVFLSCYWRERPTLLNDALTHYVERVEKEIDCLEKELAKLGSDQIAEITSTCDTSSLEKELPKLDSDQTAEITSTYDTSNSKAEVLGGGSCYASVSETETQLTYFGDSSAIVVVCAEKLPSNYGSNVDVQLPEALDCGQNAPQSDKGRSNGLAFVLGVNFPCGQSSDLHCEGGLLRDDLEKTSTDEDFCLVESILLSNAHTAEKSLASLAHLNSPKISVILEFGRLYNSPQQSDIWRINAESYSRKRKHLQAKVVEEKVSENMLVKVLAAKYRSHRKAWQQKHCGAQFGMERDKNIKRHRDDVNSLANKSSRNRWLAPGLNSEEGHTATRGFLRMPAMLLGRERELHNIVTKNGLIDDPAYAEQERKLSNPWSKEEKSVFLDKYSLFRKDFRRIASYLEHKTVADCIEFYYRNKKTEEFERVHNIHQLQKLSRFQLENYSFEQPCFSLATNPSVVSGHSEDDEDNSCYEGLLLVAEAAAVMSSPTAKPTYCGLAQACAKVAPTQFSVKGSRNVEYKGAIISHSRPRAFNEAHDEEWRDCEINLFMDAVVMFGKDFNSISQHMGTRSELQCRSFFSKARRLLCLDEHVKRHHVILQDSRAKIVVSEKSTNTINAKSDGPQWQCTDVNQGVAYPESAASTEPLQVSRDSTDAKVLASSQEAGNLVRVPQKMRALESGSYSLDDQIKQEVRSKFGGGETGCGDVAACTRFVSSSLVRNAPLLDPGKTCSLQESLICGETLQFKSELVRVKSEPLPAENTIFDGRFSSGHIGPEPLRAPSSISPLVPTVESAVESTQNKDYTSKVLETKARREPTSWSQEEKDKFVEVLKTHGKNWDRLRECLPGKSLTQIKTYFQNSKAKLGFGPLKGNGRVSSSRKRKVADSDSSSNAGSGGHNTPHKVWKVLELEGLNPSNSTTSENPISKRRMSTSFNLQASQQSYGHLNPQMVQPVVFQQPQQGTSPSVPVHPLQQYQLQQLQAEVNLQSLFNQHQQQVVHQLQQQVTKAILKQCLPSLLLQEQQLQMVAQQAPQSHFQQMPSQHQAQASKQANQVVGTRLVSDGETIANSSQPQQQVEPLQSQLHQTHIKPPPLLQQQQPIPQLHWQQQQAQLQQVMTKQVWNCHSHGQPLDVSSYTEQQQQIAVSNGSMQVTSTCTEALKQSDIDNTKFLKAQQGACEGLYQFPLNIQGAQVSSQFEPFSKSQMGAMDVKLFGQSLLSQPASCGQQNGNVSTLSTQMNFSETPPNLACGNVQPLPGPSMDGSVWSVAPFVSGCFSNVLSNELNSGGVESAVCSVQEAGSCSNKRLISGAKSNEDDQANEGFCPPDSTTDQASDRRAMSIILADFVRQPCDMERPSFESSKPTQDCEEFANHKEHVSQCSSVAISQGAFEGLPCVLDALVALAEWQIRNANVSSGKDFLSQSWEALQRDPGSLVEAGKVLVQMFTANNESSQHLKEGLEHLQPPPMHLFTCVNGDSSPVKLNSDPEGISQAASTRNGEHDERDVEGQRVVG